jgi:ABC-type Fe3+ transport system permease subunit
MNWALLGNSLLVGSITMIASMGLGFMTALWLAGLPARCRGWVIGAAVAALALPAFLVTNCWLDYFGQTGLWHRWLPWNIFSLSGTVWVMTQLLWPLTFLMVWGAWQRLEPAQLESDLLVRGRWFIRALLFPLAREALSLAALLTFVLALNNFAVPAILQVKVLPAEMWIRFNTEFDTIGALRSTYPLLVAPILLLLWFSRRPVRWPHVDAPVPARLFRQQLGPGWFLAGGFCGCFALGCSLVLPLVQIFSARRTWTELPGAVAAGQSAIWNSLWYSLAAAALVTFIGVIAAARFGNPTPKERRTNFSRLSNLALRGSLAAAWLVFLLPGVVLGIGLIHAFNHAWSSGFYQSSAIVILALVLRYGVIGYFAAGQAVLRVDRDLIEAAQLEGATRWQLLRYVLWPQIRRPVLLAGYVVFLLCLWDVESMILVVPPGGETLTLRIFNLLHYGHNAQVNALCLTLLGLALLPLVLAETGRWAWRVWQRRVRARHSTAFEPAGWVGFALVLAVVLFAACTPRSTDSLASSQLFTQAQSIGTRGVGVGQLNKPRSVAVDASDNLYVVDMTGRVQKFSSNGVFLLSWQMPEIERGKPKGMGRDLDGNIFVVEPHYSRVNLFSPMGKLLLQWGSHGTNAGELSMPRAVAINSRRQVFVSEYQEIERVQKFGLDAANGNPGSVSDSARLRRAARYLGGFGQAGTAPGEFNRPEGLCVDAQDRLYVADSCNHRIQVFASDGTFLRAYGKAGQGFGELSYPYDICVDREGRQYVCEFGNSRIQVFDSHDKPLEIIGGPGAEPGRFNNPWGVALDSSENLYVADSQNHRVQKLLRRR